MTMNDTLAAVLSHINNAEQRKKSEVIVNYSSKLIKNVLDLLQKENYIAGFEEIEDSKGNLLRIYLNGNINKVGAIKPRYAVKVDEFEKFEKRYLPARGFGILIVSTVQGLMTHEEAKQKKIGGRLIAYCY